MHTKIRFAAPDDVPLVLQFIRELAEYEHLSDSVFVTEEVLTDWITAKQIEVLLAEEDGLAVGFVLYYFTYSTFRGQTGIYIEDIFVKPEYRGRGIGTKFFRELTRIAKNRGCFRMDWAVLDWNKDGIAFYDKLGGCPVPDWITYRFVIVDS